jgi:hypothetical protein
VAAATDQRHLNAKVSITDVTAKVENDQRESVRKLAQAHGMLTKMIHSSQDLQPFKRLVR